jgi:two-component system, chemotaxis family, chemotaxis protein CheY
MAKVLIVDDSETLRTQLRKDLESRGHNVIEAIDGLDGLEKLKANMDVKLILCDVNMPNMDGLTMCEMVNKGKDEMKLPILMLTTEANASMKARAKGAGVRAWVTKPYVTEKLLAAVDTLVGK